MSELYECHYCHCPLVESNNTLTRRSNGLPPAPKGFGWVTGMVYMEGESPNVVEVPICATCLEVPNLPNLVML